MQLVPVVGAPPSGGTWWSSAKRERPGLVFASLCRRQLPATEQRAIHRGRPYRNPSAVHTAEQPNQFDWVLHVSSSFQASICSCSQHWAPLSFSFFPTLEFCLVECNWFLFSISVTGRNHMFFPIQAKDQESQRCSSHPKRQEAHPEEPMFPMKSKGKKSSWMPHLEGYHQ